MPDIEDICDIDAEGRALVETLGGRWTPDGGMCRCPAHDDRTPSLSVRPGERRLLFHCFAGCESIAVVRALRALHLVSDMSPRLRRHAPHPAIDPGQRNRGAASKIWRDACPIEGTPAEAYLTGRGLLARPAELRYHPQTPDGSGSNVLFRRAMIAAVRDQHGFVAVHRTFLDPRSPCAPSLHPRKRALGQLGQGAVRLQPPRFGTLGWAEGIETAMAATALSGIPCWATLGTERFAHVALPACVHHLILFLDHDKGGRRAEALARDAQQASGVAIEARYPPRGGMDWNDVLRGLGAATA